MMIESWMVYACAVMATRLVYVVKDDALPLAKNAILLLVQLVCLAGLFEYSSGTLYLAALLLLSALAISIFESADRISRGFRIFSLALQLLPAWLVFAFCQVTPRLFLHQWFSAELVVVIFGTLLLASESNYLVRLLFHVCKLEPKIKAGDEIDQDEYRAGRVIGILERNLIFLIVYFSGQFEAVGFMLAAKGLIRIRQLKDRQFSEYLLIGTLASAICSVLVAEALRPYC